MNPPPPDRSGRSRYGGGSSSAAQQGHHQHNPQAAAAFPFVVDPTEGPPGVRAFFPAPEAGTRAAEPSSSSVAERQQQRYGAEISLGHGMQHHHRYHQFGVEGGHHHHQDGGASAGSSLPRHSSSPPGFFSSPVVDNGFPSTRVGVGGGSDAHQAASSYNKKMKSPMNLPRQGKAGVHNNDDIIATLSNYELQFGVTKEALQMQHDQVPFRVRAKRGCATHPRSIAERERRTRISEKLRKLQALVPNMDKQTSTADMLDLAVEHIRGLQSELQALKEEKEKCNCRGNDPSRN
ncbi:hypothetical protein QOZ80_4AG0312850 [Eleusine coracana subsp. coracana]|nr:hypothetical protein QOZ80_4AG0312850 [Eleusine coracana subsp. coracana]